MTWQVKDFADGWIDVPDEAAAKRLSEQQSDAAIRPKPTSANSKGVESLERAGDDPVLRGLYSPKERKVGCVLLAAAFGIGDRRVNNIFDARDWFLAPVDDMMLMSAPLSQWRTVAAMPREQRPGPDHFAGQAATRARSGEQDTQQSEGARHG